MPARARGFLIMLWALLITSSAAWGQAQMPYYDVNTYCASESGGDNMGYSLCIDREQHDYNSLQYRWEGIKPHIQMTCIQRNPIASYTRLSACVLDLQSNDLLGGPKNFQH